MALIGLPPQMGWRAGTGRHGANPIPEHVTGLSNVAPESPVRQINTHQSSGRSQKRAIHEWRHSLATSTFNQYCYATSSPEHFLAELFDRLQATGGYNYRLIEELCGGG